MTSESKGHFELVSPIPILLITSPKNEEKIDIKNKRTNQCNNKLEQTIYLNPAAYEIIKSKIIVYEIFGSMKQEL